MAKAAAQKANVSAEAVKAAKLAGGKRNAEVAKGIEARRPIRSTRR